MPEQLTVSSITDPKLEALLAELERLRAATALHRPQVLEADGRQVCRECGSDWQCPTAEAASAIRPVIAPQSPAASAPSTPDPAEVIAGQSPGDAS
ncbi:hypothetical protein [Streptomyces sp. NPDC127100]|uniref:hypothetical protein n=1 Tax=Streptomyces sp. NPDC127100 TaxID=3347138 RepID=UPI00366899A1